MSNKELTITAQEAENIFDWMGNNTIKGDVELYDGAYPSYGNTPVFGLRVDTSESRDEIISGFIEACQIAVANKRSGSFAKELLAMPNSGRDFLINGYEKGPDYMGVFVFWNIKLIL